MFYFCIKVFYFKNKNRKYKYQVKKITQTEKTVNAQLFIKSHTKLVKTVRFFMFSLYLLYFPRINI